MKTNKTPKPLSSGMSYDKAFEELERIVSELEAEEVTVDQISERLEKAVELLEICKKKLYKTEKEVKSILASLNEE